MRIKLLLIIALLPLRLWGQDFIFGNDLSYVNQMEDCGAVFKEGGDPKDVYGIFADHGTNLVRVRLWVDPSWWQDSLVQPGGVKPHYNDLEDVKETIRRAREAGMMVMLGLHYSDFWADPGRQLIPRAWLDVAYNLEALKDSVYSYTAALLTGLEKEGLMPEFVKIGNENNGGILRHIPEENGFEAIASVSNSWARHAQLYNAAIAAVREVGSTASVNPKIVIHFSNKLNGQVWNFNNIISNGVTDFDVMGISYYYAWHGGSIKELENTIRTMGSTFPSYQVMVVETGYLWTTENFDGMGNIINEPDPGYLPVIPEKQLEYMVDYTRAVMRAGGTGVVFWEPAWVSTPCATPWGIGSSHDHVVFFDPVNTNFMENGGGNWTRPGFYSDLDARKITFTVRMEGNDTLGRAYIAGDWTGEPLKIMPMAAEGNGLYSYFTYLPSGSEGTFHFLNDTTWDAVEPVPAGCSDQASGGRNYQVGTADRSISYRWGTCEPALPPSEVRVTFRVKMEEDADLSRGVFVVGEINDWQITRMDPEGDRIYTRSFLLPPGEDSLAYYFLTSPTWDNYKNYRETVPPECALKWGSDRVIIVPPMDTVVSLHWGSCLSIDSVDVTFLPGDPLEDDYLVYPNPAGDRFYVRFPGSMSGPHIHLYELTGREIRVHHADGSGSMFAFDTGNLTDGVYILRIQQEDLILTRRLIIRKG